MRINSTVQLCSITSLWHSGQHLCRAIGRLQVRISLGFWLLSKRRSLWSWLLWKKTYLAGLQCTLTSSCAKTYLCTIRNRFHQQGAFITTQMAVDFNVGIKTVVIKIVVASICYMAGIWKRVVKEHSVVNNPYCSWIWKITEIRDRFVANSHAGNLYSETISKKS